MWALGASDLFSGAPGAPPVDGEGLRQLIAGKLDFIGVSAYAPLAGAGFPTKELENAAFMLAVRRAAAAPGVGRGGAAPGYAQHTLLRFVRGAASAPVAQACSDPCLMLCPLARARTSCAAWAST